MTLSANLLDMYTSHICALMSLGIHILVSPEPLLLDDMHEIES